MTPSVAVYIHVPFCVRKCPYCDFYSLAVGSRRPPRAFLESLLREIDLRRAELEGKTVTSVYFGGGTPSLLPAAWLGRVLDRLSQPARIPADAEITLECNPGTVERGNLREARRAGVNRLSVGVQSFREKTLRFLNRIHSAEESRRTLDEARAAGFDNVGADFIFGVPDQRLDDVLSDVEELLTFEVQHISAYELTVEEGTTLSAWVRDGRVALPGESTVAEMYLAVHRLLEAAGFEHYEVSNYALPERESRHNLTYWLRNPYVGLGPSAHSFDGKRRSWNVADWKAYLAALTRGERPVAGEEILRAEEVLEEEVALGLRLARGLDVERLTVLLGESVRTCLERDWQRWAPFLTYTGRRLRPSPEGLLRADRLALEVLETLSGCLSALSRRSTQPPAARAARA